MGCQVEARFFTVETHRERHERGRDVSPQLHILVAERIDQRSCTSITTPADLGVQLLSPRLDSLNGGVVPGAGGKRQAAKLAHEFGRRILALRIDRQDSANENRRQDGASP